mmetsp:Transcript_36419/g.61372  ORF Transcript_36419/g.61372 Transcript_36419/m.61372 type:complete len:322 (+) Transcript_36419:1240-2205(+)
MVALQHEGAEGERLCSGPIDALAGGQHLGACVVHLLHSAVHPHCVRDLGDALADLHQRVAGDTRRLHLGELIGRLEAGPVAGQPVALLRLDVLALLELIRERVGDHLVQAVDLLLRHGALRQQLLAVLRVRVLVLADDFVHQGLREGRLVDLVVPKLSVAHQVDHHVALPSLAPLRGELEDVRDGLGVVAVHVEDGHVHALRHARAVLGRPRRLRVRRERHLIVDHNVDAAADSVVRQARHVERLHDNPLPGKAAVAVEEEGHRFGAVLVAHVELLCTHLAKHQGVDGLQVGGVGDQAQVDGVAAVRRAVKRRSQVILHVT